MSAHSGKPRYLQPRFSNPYSLHISTLQRALLALLLSLLQYNIKYDTKLAAAAVAAANSQRTS